MLRSVKGWGAGLLLAITLAACGAPLDGEHVGPAGPSNVDAGDVLTGVSLNTEGSPPDGATPRPSDENTGTSVQGGATEGREGPSPEEVRANSGTRTFPKPPPATVTVNGQTQEGGTGTYCWSEAGQGICVDMVGIPTQQLPMVVPSPVDLAFGLPEDAEQLWLHIFRTDEILEVDATESELRWWQPMGMAAQITQEMAPDAPRATFTLEPGVYVVSIFGYWPQGDATYGFLIEVQ